jgi:hypothetical protein
MIIRKGEGCLKVKGWTVGSLSYGPIIVAALKKTFELDD